MNKTFLLLAGLLCSGTALAQDTYLTGNIQGLTTLPNGTEIMLDAGAPTNCEGTHHNWMFIPQTNTAMTSAALASWESGKRKVTVYTSGLNSDGLCQISQIQPQE